MCWLLDACSLNHELSPGSLHPCDDAFSLFTLPRDQQWRGDHGRAVPLLRERLCQRDGHPHGSPGHQAADELRGFQPKPTGGQPHVRSGNESRALLLAMGRDFEGTAGWAARPFPFHHQWLLHLPGCEVGGAFVFCKYVKKKTQQKQTKKSEFCLFLCNFSRA